MENVIKFKVTYILEVGDEVHNMDNCNWDEVMDTINIPKDKELRGDMFRNIFAFGVLDLSEAYQGHKVVVSLIPTKE